MHPEIAEFPNRMFYRREKLEPVPCPHQLEPELSYTLPSEDPLDDLLKAVKSASTSKDPVLYIQGVWPTGKKAYFAVPLQKD